MLCAQCNLAIKLHLIQYHELQEGRDRRGIVYSAQQNLGLHLDCDEVMIVS